MLKLNKIHKEYKLGKSQVKALRGVTLECHPGEMVAVVGPSGSGKSTLLHIAGIIDNPTSGEVIFQNKQIDKTTEKERCEYRRNYFGFIFQNFYLVDVLSAKENVALPRILNGMSLNEAYTLAEQSLIKVGLADCINRSVRNLSGGQRQRVAIARALINRPMIIFADEPTANLDCKTGNEIFDILVGMCKDEGISLLIATHDKDVMARANRIIELKDGVIEV